MKTQNILWEIEKRERELGNPGNDDKYRAGVREGLRRARQILTPGVAMVRVVLSITPDTLIVSGDVEPPKQMRLNGFESMRLRLDGVGLDKHLEIKVVDSCGY